MDLVRKLPTLEEVRLKLPVGQGVASAKARNDKELKDIFSGKSDKFILAVGPCSADRFDPVLDYVGRLAELQRQVDEVIKIVPRIYTSKPRTVGNGYKGMIHQPDARKKEENMVEGIYAVRDLHLKVVEQTGLFSVDEMLYPELIKYTADILSYVVIGARSTENQEHRLVASGLNVPVGVKNPVGGDVEVMFNSIETAQYPHHFVYNGYEVMSEGNIFTHAILRGYKKNGVDVPNYDYESLLKIVDRYDERDLENPAIVIDCNHSNSGKDYIKQQEIATEVLASMRKDERIRQVVKGLMIESYIEDGCQPINGTIYGKSITDPCLGWEKTERMVFEICDNLGRL